MACMIWHLFLKTMILKFLIPLPIPSHGIQRIFCECNSSSTFYSDRQNARCLFKSGRFGWNGEPSLDFSLTLPIPIPLICNTMPHYALIARLIGELRFRIESVSGRLFATFQRYFDFILEMYVICVLSLWNRS